MKEVSLPSTWGSVVLLLICLVAVNLMAHFFPLRYDLTEERLYTISEGSRKILAGLTDPVRINFYYSRNNSELPPNFKIYAQRVQELLEEYVALSKGMVVLKILDPKPDTDEEEWAQKYGIKPITLPSGNTVYFGAVISMLDQEMLLPYFDQRRENFLEYDISQAIQKVGSTSTSKVGLLSVLNLQGGRSMIPGQPPAQKWVFFSELENFDLSKYTGVIKIVVGILVVGVTGYTSVFTVDPEERAVVLRFGKVDREVGQGLHFKLPFFMDQEFKVPVQRQLKLEFGFRSPSEESEFQEGFPSTAEGGLAESLMLTGDLNVANVEWVTQYTIVDPAVYLFKVRNVDRTFRDMNEAVMREVVGDRTINEVLTTGRGEIQDEAMRKLQALVKAKAYTLGITVDRVILQSVSPPDEVKPAFNEVNQAEQEMKTTILNAEATVQREIPKAEGTAKQTIEGAEGYAVKRVNEAMGAASRFTQVFEEYKKAPEITRQRIYLETMSDIYQAVDRKIIIDENVNGVLPLLNLDRER